MLGYSGAIRFSLLCAGLLLAALPAVCERLGLAGGLLLAGWLSAGHPVPLLCLLPAGSAFWISASVHSRSDKAAGRLPPSR